jgi:hypothetical protein
MKGIRTAKKEDPLAADHAGGANGFLFA